MLKDNNKEAVNPQELIGELCDDNRQLTRNLRATHEICDRYNDIATASLIETWIDETERRAWFLSEIARAVKSHDPVTARIRKSLRGTLRKTAGRRTSERNR